MEQENQSAVHLSLMRTELLKMADLLQELMDGRLTQTEVAGKAGMSHRHFRYVMEKGMHVYIREKLTYVPAIVHMLSDMRSPADRLVMAILGMEDRPSDGTMAGVPDYDEDELWSVARNVLQPREYEIVQLHMGVPTGKPQSFAQIGNDLGISRQFTTTLYDRAIAKLRRPELLIPVFPGISPVPAGAIEAMELQLDDAKSRFAVEKAKYDEAARKWSSRTSRLEQAAACVYGMVTEWSNEDRGATGRNDHAISEMANNGLISNRLANGLSGANVNTLEDIAAMDADDVRNIKNLGTKSRRELYTLLLTELGCVRKDIL